MAALLRFALILALASPFGLLGYLMPAGLWERLALSWRKHTRLAMYAPYACLLVAIAMYVVVFSTLSILRHLALGTHAFDLGVYDQVIWNSAHGNLFEFSLAEKPFSEQAMSYLGFHFSPGLLLLVPLYWIAADVRVLLVVQTVAIAAVAIPVYLIALETLKRKAAALALSVAYLLSPAIGYINLFDFHSIAITMPFIAFATYFMRRRRYVWWGVTMVVAMSFKEEIAIVTAAMGIYIAVKQRSWLVGMASFVGAAFWLYLVLDKIIPFFRGDSYYYLAQYSYLGGSTGEIARSLLTNPIRLLEIMVDPSRLEFAFHLLVPLGLVPLLGFSALLVTLPVFAYLFASAEPGKYSIIFHYSAPLVVLIFAASVDGIRRLADYLSSIGGKQKGRPALLAIVCFILAASMLSSYFHGRGPLGKGYVPSSYRPLPGSSAVYRAIAMIPAEASVSAHRDIVPQLSHRRFIYLFPDVHDADFLLLWEGKEDAQSGPDLAEWQKNVATALADPRYELLLHEEGFILMRKGNGNQR